MRDPQWQDLTRERDVLRLDLRGFGEQDERPFAKWSHHRVGIETLNGLGIDAVHAIGSSLGAGVAVASPWPHPGRMGFSAGTAVQGNRDDHSAMILGSPSRPELVIEAPQACCRGLTR